MKTVRKGGRDKKKRQRSRRSDEAYDDKEGRGQRRRGLTLTECLPGEEMLSI